MRHNSPMVGASEQTITASPLLETKFYIPKWRPGQVDRQELVERLQQGIDRKLTLISAPAGFGKSTLLAEWFAATSNNGHSVAWVSLDHNDNDPTLFWAYFITAVQKVKPGVGESTLTLLHSHPAPPIEVLLRTLLNEISASTAETSTGPGPNLVLVLDDYHAIDAEPIHTGMRFLLEHLPPQMHLVITGRADPPLPLARLRGRGESAEFRTHDLRFTVDEATAFIRDVMGLELSVDHVAALETRTEGWIAGLQLAALSIQGRDDVSGFINAFTGNDRYIVDYLVEEVLQSQPDRVRSFLLQTSVLDRMSGPLCDSITGQEDGESMLELLERGNLFLVPLDGNRRWYRYHHLFGEVLYSRLTAERPDQLSDLHRKAGDWYTHNGLPSDVVRHALAAKDFGRAAGVIELEALAMMSRCEEPTLLEWMKSIPDDVIRTRPVLSVYYAFILLSYLGSESVEHLLRDAERWLDTPPEEGEQAEGPLPEMVVVDEKGFQSLPGAISMVRAYAAGIAGDVPGIVTHARQALDFLPADDYYWRGIATAFLGLSYWANGDLEAAYEFFTDGIASLRRGGNHGLEAGGAGVSATLRAAQGRLREAVRLYEQSLQVLIDQGEPFEQGTTDLYVGLSDLQLERGELDAARRSLARSEELDEHAAMIENRHRSRVVRARLKQVEGDLDGALDLLSEAERLFFKSPSPDIHPIATLKARIWVSQGRLVEAADWARGRGLSVDDEPNYLAEFDHITFVKMLITRFKTNLENDPADNSISAVFSLLERLLKAAEEGGRTGSVIEVLVMQALAHEATGDIPDGLTSIGRAIALAEPEGFVQVFVDEGEAMRTLVQRAVAEGIETSYAGRLLSAFQAQPEDAPEPKSTGASSVSPELTEQLTGREVEILRLIAAGMTNQEIAERLVVSMSTIKTHINRTYRKLDVHSRTQAVARIGELGIA